MPYQQHIDHSGQIQMRRIVAWNPPSTKIEQRAQQVDQIIRENNLIFDHETRKKLRVFNKTGHVSGLEDRFGNLIGLVTDGVIVWARQENANIVKVHLDHFVVMKKPRVSSDGYDPTVDILEFV